MRCLALLLLLSAVAEVVPRTCAFEQQQHQWDRRTTATPIRNALLILGEFIYYTLHFAI